MESRKQFFAYILTLLRGQFCEMEGMLPAVDVTSMEHLAWTFDSLFYLLQVRECVCVWGGGAGGGSGERECDNMPAVNL